MAEGRIPPQAFEMEQAVLGAMLTEKEAVQEVLDILRPEDFYKPSHEIIFRAVSALSEKNDPVDILTVSELLKSQGDAEKTGAEPYLVELTMKAIGSVKVAYHARIVKEKSIARELIAFGSRTASEAFDEAKDIFQVLEASEKRLYEIATLKSTSEPRQIALGVQGTMEMLDKTHGHKTGITGVEGGFFAIDSMLGGFQKGDLIVVGGRPSQGKTALGLDFCRNSARKNKTRIGFFSLEMTLSQLIIRLLAREADVNSHRLRTGRLTDEEIGRVAKVQSVIGSLPIFVNDTPSLRCSEIRSQSRKLKQEQNIELIVVDYLQLIRAEKNNQTREQEISEISSSLKALAKELDIPVVALCQLNRSVESRSDKRPVLSDLREGGTIEQDADVVMFVHRPETYGVKEIDGKSTEGLAEIIVAKQRNGPTGAPQLRFIKENAHFENLNPVREGQVEAGMPW